MSAIIYKKEDINNLILLSQKADMRALEELIRRIQKDVFVLFSYLIHSRQDVSDLTQEALLKIAKNINNLKETSSFKSWLNHIVTNTYYDYLRIHSSDKNILKDEDKILNIKESSGCEPGEKCLYSEMDKIIQTALLALPENLRIVIILREYEGLSYEDISEITKTSLGTVKSRISRARAKLQSQLKDFI